jgi:GNAT superfamily N-acetyltransferase
VIREFRPEDAAAIVAITRRTRPFLPVSEDSLLHRYASEPAEAAARQWVADGAYAHARLAWDRRPSGGGGLGVVVDPDRRGRGLGAALYETALAYLEELGVRKFTCWCQSEGAAFLDRRGWERRRESFVSTVEVRAAGTVEPPRGIRLASLSEVDPRLVYELDHAASGDEPGEDDLDIGSYETWVRTQLEKPLLDASASVLAVEDGVPVAMAWFKHDGRIGLNDFTCTAPDRRGRGLATLVKAAVLQRAAERGIERITTMNDAENGPMLRVNEKLGYRRIATDVLLVRERTRER